MGGCTGDTEFGAQEKLFGGACAHSNLLQVTRQLPKSLTWCRRTCGLMGGFGGLVWAGLEEFHMPGRTCAKKPEQPCKLPGSRERETIWQNSLG